MTAPRRTNRTAVTLVELTLALVLVAAVVLMAMRMLTGAQRTANVQNLLGMIQQVRQAVDERDDPSRKPDYTAPAATLTAVLPYAYDSETQLWKVGGYRVRVQANGASRFEIIAYNLPGPACMQIAQTEVRGAEFWTIDSANDMSAVPLNIPYAPSVTAFQSPCSGALNAVGWVF